MVDVKEAVRQSPVWACQELNIAVSLSRERTLQFERCSSRQARFDNTQHYDPAKSLKVRYRSKASKQMKIRKSIDPAAVEITLPSCVVDPATQIAYNPVPNVIRRHFFPLHSSCIVQLDLELVKFRWNWEEHNHDATSSYSCMNSFYFSTSFRVEEREAHIRVLEGVLVT